MADSPDDFVWAFRRDNGERHRVPANRLTHPRLRKYWRKTAPPASSSNLSRTTDAPAGHDTEKEN